MRAWDIEFALYRGFSLYNHERRDLFNLALAKWERLSMVVISDESRSSDGTSGRVNRTGRPDGSDGLNFVTCGIFRNDTSLCNARTRARTLMSGGNARLWTQMQQRRGLHREGVDADGRGCHLQDADAYGAHVKQGRGRGQSGRRRHNQGADVTIKAWKRTVRAQTSLSGRRRGQSRRGRDHQG